MNEKEQAELIRKGLMVLFDFYVHIKECPTCQASSESRYEQLEELKKKHQIPEGWKSEGFEEDIQRIWRMYCTNKVISGLIKK